MNKMLDKMSSRTILAATFLLSALPIALVIAFPGQFNYAMASAEYVVFHNIAEFFSIMVCLSIFGVGWYTFDQTKDRHALFLSAAFLVIGLIDFMHTLSNVAMPAFITPNTSNKSTQFWIAVRLFQGVAFLAGAFVYSGKFGAGISKRSLLTAALLVPTVVFSAVVFFPGIMPDTFVPGTGLTPFKKISEYLAAGLLFAALAAYGRQMARTNDPILIYYLAALIISIFGELNFAVYTKVFDTFNVLGHVYKVAAFGLIYKGIFIASVREPYRKLAEVSVSRDELSGEIEVRKRTEEALRQAYARLRMFFDRRIGGIGIVIANARGDILEANDYYLDILGCSRDELLAGRVDWRKMTPPEWLSADEKALAQLRERGACDPYEKEYIRGDGSRVPVLLTDVMMPGESGEILAIVVNITDHKRTEQRLQRENREIELASRMLRVFVEETGDALYDRALGILMEGMGSRHGVFGYVDERGHLICPSMTRMLGQCEIEGKCIEYPPEKWKGLWARALREKRTIYTNEPPRVPPGHPPINSNLAAPILFQGNVIGLFNLANKEGGYTESDRELLEAVAGRIAPVLYAWIQRELREIDRRQAGTVIIQSLRRFELLAYTAGELLQAPEPQKVVESLCRRVMEHLDCHAFFNFLVDDETGRLHLNACAGIPREEARKIEWLDFGVAVCGCAARDATPIVAEQIPTTPDERTDLMRSYGIKAYCCHPLLGPAGKVIGTLSFGTRSRETFSPDDLSLMKAVTDQVALAMDRMRGERSLLQRSVELEAVNRELEAFIYSVSHDLRAPLRSVSGFAQAIVEDYSDRLDERGRDYLVRIRDGSVKMTRLIDDLLHLSRISRQEISRGRVDLSAGVSSLVAELRQASPERDVEVVIAEGLAALADHGLMKIVLTNIVGNAWKFTSKMKGARIEFGTEAGPVRSRDRVPRDGAATGPVTQGETVFYVRDNGAGFDPAYRDKMFLPFQRLHSHHEFEGTGIGLTIVERIIHRHGGKVWAEGAVGKGATVYFTLG